ncbi:hypothetical protein DMC30DRAFT_66397 [Rhodotorula diobovata]|uniref:Uncharacterized protein n=1 Tax=Rhodotorula diobovata TaxID=5288 RepID=A0A5C5G1W7_9BASI|nr:hypothetical protein DMC30DRAFT_66397 [Rhodotorula diobovata]
MSAGRTPLSRPDAFLLARATLLALCSLSAWCRTLFRAQIRCHDSSFGAQDAQHTDRDGPAHIPRWFERAGAGQPACASRPPESVPPCVRAMLTDRTRCSAGTQRPTVRRRRTLSIACEPRVANPGRPSPALSPSQSTTFWTNCLKKTLAGER